MGGKVGCINKEQTHQNQDNNGNNKQEDGLGQAIMTQIMDEPEWATKTRSMNGEGDKKDGCIAAGNDKDGWVKAGNDVTEDEQNGPGDNEDGLVRVGNDNKEDEWDGPGNEDN